VASEKKRAGRYGLDGRTFRRVVTERGVGAARDLTIAMKEEAWGGRDLVNSLKENFDA